MDRDREKGSGRSGGRANIRKKIEENRGGRSEWRVEMKNERMRKTKKQEKKMNKKRKRKGEGKGKTKVISISSLLCNTHNTTETIQNRILLFFLPLLVYGIGENKHITNLTKLN